MAAAPRGGRGDAGPPGGGAADGVPPRSAVPRAVSLRDAPLLHSGDGSGGSVSRLLFSGEDDAGGVLLIALVGEEVAVVACSLGAAGPAASLRYALRVPYGHAAAAPVAAPRVLPPGPVSVRGAQSGKKRARTPAEDAAYPPVRSPLPLTPGFPTPPLCFTAVALSGPLPAPAPPSTLLLAVATSSRFVHLLRLSPNEGSLQTTLPCQSSVPTAALFTPGEGGAGTPPQLLLGLRSGSVVAVSAATGSATSWSFGLAGMVAKEWTKPSSGAAARKLHALPHLTACERMHGLVAVPTPSPGSGPWRCQFVVAAAGRLAEVSVGPGARGPFTISVSVRDRLTNLLALGSMGGGEGEGGALVAVELPWEAYTKHVSAVERKKFGV